MIASSRRNQPAPAAPGADGGVWLAVAVERTLVMEAASSREGSSNPEVGGWSVWEKAGAGAKAGASGHADCTICRFAGIFAAKSCEQA